MIEVSSGSGPNARCIACLARGGEGPAVIWLGGFRSDMRATKAEALDRWAETAGRRFVRFDYSGHGESDGRFEDGTIGRWLEDALAVIEGLGGPRPVLVGSSMGGWIALLAATRLAVPPSGLVLIAPAPDFTEALMWPSLPEEGRAAIERDGIWHAPSAYSPEPTPLTRALFEDGRTHTLLDAPIPLRCPVHILQGMEDPDVPWRHALRLVERLPERNVVLSLIREGDHRLSREADLARLTAAVEGIVPRQGA